MVHHHADGCFDWLISGHQSVNPSREVITKDLCLSILYKLYFLSVHKLLLMLILATSSQTSHSCFPLSDVDYLEIANCSNVTTVFYPSGNVGQALCIRLCHEDLLLTRKSHNCAGLHSFRGTLQVVQS